VREGNPDPSAFRYIRLGGVHVPIAIVVHGGAGPRGPEDRAEVCIEGCRRAARAGYEVLRSGGTALDAVEVAAAILEDDPTFNAGTGSVLTSEGRVEMDASMMSGTDLECGAVALIQNFQNPVRLARAVMEKTRHVFLAGEGAERFARENGFAPVDPSTLITPRARARWEREQRALEPARPGTIGAVALDAQGRVAAATSTGGTSSKRPGRIGDTPVIGAGTYADDQTGAASSTGHGESILKVALAKTGCDLIASGLAAPAAAERAVATLARVRGQAGLILVSRLGDIGIAFNTERMSRAWVDADGREGAAF
jgi:L-asparaginase / beta-aspartyl-peptidase